MWEQRFRSVCPVCDRPVEGRYFEEDGRVLMRKACPEHGEVTDLASPDARVFIEKMALASEDHSKACSLALCGRGIVDCPGHHAKKSPVTFIELTPRCNMRCPVCYIDASTRGEDLPFEDVERMVAEVKRYDPATHLVLIGGEPTIHREFFRILDLLRREGLIKRCYLATNGITLADEAFCRKIFEMGIRWVYLAFDATDREICREIRGSYRAYEASRKAIENLRALRRIRVVLAVTVVKGLNDRDLGNVVDFALENRDVVKRISISAEVYCGRQTTSEDLLRNRVTAEHIEGVLREKLGVRMPTMSLAVVGVLLAPLKAAGIIRSGYWVETMPHPLCGNIGILGKRSDGRFTSLIDRAVRRPTRVYRYAARVERLAERMGRRRDALSRSAAGRGLWKLLAFGGYLPLYFVMLLSFLRPGFAWRALAASLFSFVSRKKARNVLLGRKRVEIHYLIGCDKYNFTWERMPYCATHHYRLDPRSGEILKMCGCYVIPFRPYANACGKIE